MFGMTRGRLFGGVAVVAALGLAMGLTFAGDDAVADGEGRPAIQTGTYQPQAVFERYHRTQELITFIEELEVEAQQAQQAGDQQKLMELQQRFQSREQALMEAFIHQMDDAVPAVAREAGVDLIALEIQYAAPHIGDPTDLTEQIVSKINAGATQPDDE